MTRKIFIKLFTFAFTVGLLIVFSRIFIAANYPILSICMYILIGMIIVYSLFILSKSGLLLYPMYRVSIFILIISVPFFPLIINGHDKFLNIFKPAVHTENIEKVQLEGKSIFVKQEAVTSKKMIADGFQSLRALKNIPQEYEDFFNNHFPLRSAVGRTYNSYAIRHFKKPSNDKVIIGDNGWLFYKGDDGKQTIDDYIGKQSFSVYQLETIRTRLEKYNSDLHKKNIKFVVVVPPNKESIYGEFLPKFYFKGKTSKLEQLKNYLKEKNSDVNLLDLKEVILKDKKVSNRQYYFYTDTHWNDSGAYFAYSSILKHLNIEPIAEDNFFRKEKIYSGDIAVTMLNCEGIITEKSIFYEPKIMRTAKRIDRGGKDFITITENNKLPRAVIFRDSFSTQIQPYISEHFSRISWIYNHKIDMKLIEEENPNYVIVEIGERGLPELLTL